CQPLSRPRLRGMLTGSHPVWSQYQRHMNRRVLYFVLAAAILVVLRIVMLVARRRGRPFLTEEGGLIQHWSLFQLLLASFLTLFAELAFIRWIAVEIRVFAYFKNLALL